MPLSNVLAFWAVSILFIITPGADWAYAITAGIRNRSYLPAVLGMIGGHVLGTVVVAAGVGALVTEFPAVLTVLTLAGAGYLLWLGIRLLRSHAAPLTADPTAPRESARRQALRGLGVSGLNPKVYLLFLALLPQFSDPSASWPVAGQIVTLGLLHAATCAAVYVVVAATAKKLLAARPKGARTVTRLSGALMIVIALILISEKILT